MKKAILVLLILVLFTSCNAVQHVDKEKELKPQYKDETVRPSGNNDENLHTQQTDDIIQHVEVNNESLQTQQKYGIVPYVSKSRTYYSEYGTKSIVNSYGFCNLDGDVVVEPRNDISVLVCHTANDGFSFYEVGIGQSEQSTYADGFDPMKTLIIPANGEWCVELDEVGWWTITAGDGAIFASLDSTRENWIIEAKTLIYDYNGNLIKEFGPSSYVSGYSETYKDCVEISLINGNPDDYVMLYVNSKGEEVENPVEIPYEYTADDNTLFDEYGFNLEASSEDERFVVYVDGEIDYDDYRLEEDDRVAYLYDRINKEQLHSFHGNCYAEFLGNNDRFVYMYNSDDIEGGNTYNYCLYDTEKRKLLVEDAEDIQHFSADGMDYFAVSYKNSSSLYDGNFNLIKKVYFE